MTIEEHYQDLCLRPSDIFQHLPTLKKYATGCDLIIELGTRSIVSTWALLAGHPKQMLSVDIVHPKTFGADIWQMYDACNNEQIDYEFIQKSSLEIILPEHDLLFIDTLHTYEQLKAELERHHDKPRKYIIMHDTNLVGEDEMQRAVNEFLDAHLEWEVKEHFLNNNGLTVMHRI